MTNIDSPMQRNKINNNPQTTLHVSLTSDLIFTAFLNFKVKSLGLILLSYNIFLKKIEDRKMNHETEIK